MLNRIIFFELCHYGDLHITRNFVRYVIDNIKANDYTYVLDTSSSKVFADFSELKFEKYDVAIHPFAAYSPWKLENNILYINTSCGASDMAFFNGTTIQTAYAIFSHFLQTLCNHTMSKPITDFIPIINYNNFKIDAVNKFMEQSANRKKIMIVVGEGLSGQVLNFDMYPIVQILAHEFPNYLFFVSNKLTNIMHLHNIAFNTCDANIVCCEDILKLTENDIVETSYISSFCDVIIGRSSGVYILSIEKRNVIDNPKKFICICHAERDKDIGISNLIPQLADNFIWSNSFDYGKILDISRKVLSDLYAKM